jgi:hypothetical protein
MSNKQISRVLSIYLLFTASTGLFLTPAAPSTTDSKSVIPAPSRAYEVGARVTAAPELKRQISAPNQCSEWSLNGNSFSSAESYEHNI